MQGLLGAVEAGQEEVERQAALSLQLAKDREGERRLLSVRSELAERMDTGLLLVDGKVTAVEAALDEETSSRAASNMMSMVKTTGLIEEAEARRVSGDKSLQVLSPPSLSLSPSLSLFLLLHLSACLSQLTPRVTPGGTGRRLGPCGGAKGHGRPRCHRRAAAPHR